MAASAYWSEEYQCWYVPVSSELFREFESLEPVRLELKDGQLLVTRLDPTTLDSESDVLDPDSNMVEPTTSVVDTTSVVGVEPTTEDSELW
jgi:hypothetical protein